LSKKNNVSKKRPKTPKNGYYVLYLGMKKTLKEALKKIIAWLEEDREARRLWRIEHPYPRYGHQKSRLVDGFLRWVWRGVCRWFWWGLDGLKRWLYKKPPQ
jgi:hypothetical protein